MLSEVKSQTKLILSYIVGNATGSLRRFGKPEKSQTGHRQLEMECVVCLLTFWNLGPTGRTACPTTWDKCLVGSGYYYILWVLAYIVRISIISPFTQMFGFGVA